jgi:transposase
MRALVVKSRLSALGLSKAAKMEQDVRIRKRLQALSLRKQGWLVCDVATALLVTARTVENWINRYNQKGRNGLKEQPRTGAPIKLKNISGFCRRIDAGADVKDNQVSTLHGKEIQRILKDDFGAEYALSGVYCLLHRLGYSSLKPRPYHAKADPMAQEVFKKTLVSK